MRGLGWLVVLAFVGCKSGADEPPALEPICGDAVGWAPGTPIFSETTDAWGLTGVQGVRLVAVDFDGDGWTDLSVHTGGDAAEDFGADGPRRSWLLRNVNGERFEDVTESSGFRALRGEGAATAGRPGSVVGFADIDNDGDLDAITAVSDADGSNPETSEILLNQGDGTFVLGDAASPIREDARFVPAGVTFVDYDRDGNVDVWMPQNSVDGVPQQDRLYRGDGEGGFTEATDDAGLRTKAWNAIADLDAGLAHTNAWSSLACDLNDDGDPELLAASYGRAPDHLWVNRGGTFENRSVASGYAYDANLDWTDNEFARCHCQLHPTDVDCAGLPAPRVRCNSDADVQVWRHQYDRNAYRLGGNSAESACIDLDNDGDLDLLTGSIHHWWAGENSDSAEVLLNTGDPEVVLDRPGREATGLAHERDRVDWNDGEMTNSVIDFDNDGMQDVYFGNSDYPGAHGRLHHQEEPGHWHEVAIADAIDQLRSHGSAVADFDHDGDLDLVVGHSRARCGGSYEHDCYETSQIRFFENALGGNFVQLRLAGTTGTNTAAIGARVQVTAGGITQTQELGGGGGHYGSQDDLQLHFGLGAACEAEVTIRWPDAALTTQTFTVPAGYRFDVVQGSDPVPMD